jgi:purine-nucleoside phosphorylase
MGSFAVKMQVATQARKNVLCLLTISDCILTGESLLAKDRQLRFTDYD